MQTAPVNTPQHKVRNVIEAGQVGNAGLEQALDTLGHTNLL